MFVGSLFLVLAAPGAPLSASDTAFLTRIDKAVSRMSDRKTAFVRFEKTVTKADAIRCNQVLPHLKPNSVSYADCAFVQAWYGIDYAANIQRLLRPFHLWRVKPNQWKKEYPQGNDIPFLVDKDSLYLALRYLYLKGHDLRSLSAWEDMPSDADLLPPYSRDLRDLWDDHAADMLRAAYGHPQRIKNLAYSFSSFSGDPTSEYPFSEAVADARALRRSKDKRVAGAAQALVSVVHSGKY